MQSVSRTARVDKSKSKRSILVVDDEKWLVESLDLALRKHKYNVIPAYSYDDAIAALQREKIDLIVTDIAMERKDGLQLVKEVRENPRFKELPVIVQSGFGDQMQKEAIALKARAVFQKPVKMEDLLWAIHDALGTKTKK